MKQQLATLISAGLKYLIGLLVAALIGWNLLSADDARSIDAETAAAVTTVSGFVAAILTGVAQAAWRKFFPVGTNKDSGAVSVGDPLPLILLCTVVAGSLLLPSCADFRGTGGLYYRDPETGAKAGLRYEGGEASYTARVPVYDDQGNVIAWAEMSGPLAREVTATK